MIVSAPSIRPLQPPDLPALQHIRQAAFEPVFRSFHEIVGAEVAAVAFTHAEVEQAKLLDAICAAGSGHHVLVVTVGGEMVGFVSFTTDTERRLGEIGLNAVHPDHASRGLGTWMYQYIMARMQELGMALAQSVRVVIRAMPLRDAPTRRPVSDRRFHRFIYTSCSDPGLGSENAHVLGMRRSNDTRIERVHPG